MVYCYVLERNTASVFHAMRVAEYGLRFLAKRIRATVSHSGKPQRLEYAEWDKVITAIKNKLDPIRRLPSGPQRQSKLEMFSDAADHCTFMKDIFRNNVSHTRKPYKPSEALGVIERVRDFMIFIAENFTNEKRKRV